MSEKTDKGGWYCEELCHPLHKVMEAGMDYVICSIKGGPASNVDPASVTDDGFAQDPLKKEIYDKIKDNELKDCPALGSLKGADFDAILLVGGFGVMFDYYPNADIDRVGREVYENGGVVAAVCHGPIGLCAINLSDGTPLVKDKAVAGFTDEEEGMLKLNDAYPTYPTGTSVQTCLTALGGKHESVPAWGEKAIVDNRVVSGQNPASANKVGELIVEALK
jgi:putative intracellular protease/amidase